VVFHRLDRALSIFFHFFRNLKILKFLENFCQKNFRKSQNFGKNLVWVKFWDQIKMRPLNKQFFFSHHSDVFLTENFDFSKYICWCNHVTILSELLPWMFLHDYLTLWPLFHSPIKFFPWRSKWGKNQLSKWTKIGLILLMQMNARGKSSREGIKVGEIMSETSGISQKLISGVHRPSRNINH